MFPDYIVTFCGLFDLWEGGSLYRVVELVFGWHKCAFYFLYAFVIWIYLTYKDNMSAKLLDEYSHVKFFKV